MARIFPPVAGAHMVKEGALHADIPALSELGIYGVSLSDSKGVMLNEVAGHVIRTKAEGVDEGGVATGYAVLDSPLLV